MRSISISRQFTRFGAGVVLAGALGLSVSDTAPAASVSASSTAKIVTAIGVTKAADLRFGSIVADGASAGSVAMSAAGARTCTTVTCVAQDAGGAASFNVTGEAGYTYAITLPNSSITLTHGTDNTKTMTVDTFTGSKSTGTLTDGSDSFSVGATLSVAAAQTAGTYTGTFSVSVDYN